MSDYRFQTILMVIGFGKGKILNKYGPFSYYIELSKENNLKIDQLLARSANLNPNILEYVKDFKEKNTIIFGLDEYDLIKKALTDFPKINDKYDRISKPSFRINYLKKRNFYLSWSKLFEYGKIVFFSLVINSHIDEFLHETHFKKDNIENSKVKLEENIFDEIKKLFKILNGHHEKYDYILQALYENEFKIFKDIFSKSFFDKVTNLAKSLDGKEEEIENININSLDEMIVLKSDDKEPISSGENEISEDEDFKMMMLKSRNFEPKKDFFRKMVEKKEMGVSITKSKSETSYTNLAAKKFLQISNSNSI